MAKTAKREDEEAQEIVQPDYEKALRIMRADIKPAEEQNAESRGHLSAAWKAIEEEANVNKAAAKIFRKQVLEASVDKRDDFLRSLYGLMRAASIGISRDLVDLAEGAENRMPVEGEFDDENPVRAAGITGDNLPPELKTRGGKKPALVTVN